MDRRSGHLCAVVGALVIALTLIVGAPAGADPVVAAAGDIACTGLAQPGPTDLCRQAATAALIVDAKPTVVTTLGDNQYETASLAEFGSPGAYNDTWGAFKSSTYPTPGNHEYDSPNAVGYFGYFGAGVGVAGRAHYSQDVGDWHLISLDSDCGPATDCFGDGQVTQEELAWLQADLAAHPGVCTLAYWHHPLYYDAGTHPGVKPLWDALLAAHADVVLNGHLRYYERFARQDAVGAPDAGGLREFIVGTGGKGLMTLTGSPANKEFATDKTLGVLFMTLHPGGYDWQFRATDGTTPDASSSPTACNRDATSTSVSAAPAPAAPGDGITLDAAVRDDAGTATGDVTFTLDGTVAGRAAVDGSGHARLVVGPQDPGTHQVTASYSGSNSALRSASAPTAVNVAAAAPPDAVPPAGGTPAPVITLPPPVATTPRPACSELRGDARSRCAALLARTRALAACRKLPTAARRAACTRSAGARYALTLRRLDRAVCAKLSPRSRRAACATRADARYRSRLRALARKR